MFGDSATRLESTVSRHQDHPVSEYERHRNQAIFAMQGNRNPLVDHPDWATALEFQNGLG
ncbi:MAG: endonuclease [Planctomycetota bacterium]|nr:endonuclease [Planctomycetota bacterium]